MRQFIFRISSSIVFQAPHHSLGNNRFIKTSSKLTGGHSLLQIKMTTDQDRLDDQLEKIEIADERTKQKALNERNNGISDELKECATSFNVHFQDLELREEARYRVTNYSSNLFSKSAETSQKYRKMGNELYAEQRYAESLTTYNQVSLEVLKRFFRKNMFMSWVKSLKFDFGAHKD